MNSKIRTLSCAFVMTLVTGASTFAGDWQCTAKDLADYNYDGGETIYVRLAQFNRGSHYSVTKSKDGKKATGVTGNGTPFTCTKKD